MHPKSLTTCSSLFALAIVIQIMAVSGNFYLQHYTRSSRDALLDIGTIENHFLTSLARENTGDPPGQQANQAVQNCTKALEIMDRNRVSLDRSFVEKRIDMIESTGDLADRQRRMHRKISALLPDLSDSIEYIHAHHIAHLKNLIQRGTSVQDYDDSGHVPGNRDHAIPETAIIESAVRVQHGMLKIFETFSQIQSGRSPNRIKDEFKERTLAFYGAVNRFEDYSLDAQDGILVEELLINGRIFETSFKDFLDIESRLIELNQRLSENRDEFLTQLKGEKTRINTLHQDLEKGIRSIQYFSIGVSVIMLALLLWFGWLIIKGFRSTVEETRYIQDNIEYSITPPKHIFKELAIVFEALNAMAETIRKQMADLKLSKQLLEKRVKQRTAQLSSVNEKLKAEIRERVQGEKQRMELEKRLFQAQKLESIGTLAGGIAHDFNNILAGIFGFCELAQKNVATRPEKARNHIQMILKGAHRAADLVRQILTYSRKTAHEKQVIRLDELLHEIMELIRSTVPSSIEIRVDLDSDALIQADPTQIHQVVMNLCTNASHSMRENGGILSVALKDAPSDSGNGPGLESKSLAVLTIRDTGTGISSENLGKIFDPYFTTKGLGQGTGLGLALAQAIVHEHQGRIEVNSREGSGTQFSIFLPHSPEKADGQARSQKDKGDKNVGHEHIMLVDDEPSILESLKYNLEDLGYRVSDFGDPEKALEAFSARPQAFDLVISDITMPKMTGDILARKISDLKPEIPIILFSGYSEKLFETKNLNQTLCRHLLKPVNTDDLALMIRELLDHPLKTPDKSSPGHIQ